MNPPTDQSRQPNHWGQHAELALYLLKTAYNTAHDIQAVRLDAPSPGLPFTLVEASRRVTLLAHATDRRGDPPKTTIHIGEAAAEHLGALADQVASLHLYAYARQLPDVQGSMPVRSSAVRSSAQKRLWDGMLESFGDEIRALSPQIISTPAFAHAFTGGIPNVLLKIADQMSNIFHQTESESILAAASAFAANAIRPQDTVNAYLLDTYASLSPSQQAGVLAAATHDVGDHAQAWKLLQSGNIKSPFAKLFPAFAGNNSPEWADSEVSPMQDWESFCLEALKLVHDGGAREWADLSTYSL